MLDGGHEVLYFLLHLFELILQTSEIGGVGGFLLEDLHCPRCNLLYILVREDVLDCEANYKLLYPVLFLYFLITLVLPLAVNALVIVVYLPGLRCATLTDHS